MDTVTDKEIEHDVLNNNLAKIIIHNDDVNTFEHVIDCLISRCEHSFEQAEQLSLLIHYKGKAVVKTGFDVYLIPINNALLSDGLSAELETI